MKPFENVSRDGNEKAIRRGKVVPEGDVNLAFVKSPALNPKDNVVIVDTSRITEENILEGPSKCKLYYANSLGILEDEDGNIAIGDQYPIITDVFTVEEDFSTFPGSEYSDGDILPYLHVSRHFHLDFASLTMGDDVVTYKDESVKVVDSRGVEYPKYRTKIAAAYFPGSVTTGSNWAYRVYAYVDTDKFEDLYLVYNKVELDETGALVNRKIEYKELLNPQPYFEYTPEESDVIDPANRDKKIYNTKPLAYKDQILDTKSKSSQGYKVYVPRKAVGDPRLYQLFRWRVTCSFKQTTKIDPSRDTQTINCGVLVTTSDLGNSVPSRAPYALLNLSRSAYNSSGITFRNPAKDNHAASEQEKRSYWLVNIDTDDLSQYDLLIWAPNALTFDYSPYAGKISNFISTHGGTLFFDTNDYVDPYNTAGGTTTASMNPNRGVPRDSATTNPHTTPVEAFNIRWNADGKTHPLVEGAKHLGGWDVRESVGNNELHSMSFVQHAPSGGFSQSYQSIGPAYTRIFEAPFPGTSTYKPLLVAREIKKGRRIMSTFGILKTCSSLYSYQNNSLVSHNHGSRISSNEDYQRHINGVGVEGAMKILYNAALWALKGRLVDNSDEEKYSTTWEYSTPWKASWVINADDDVLSDQEKAEHNFLIDARDLHATVPDTTPVWKRRLSNKTVKKLMDEVLAPIRNNPLTKNRVEGSTRSYRIEITNPNVQVSSVVVENDYPQAWTEAYTPKFTVPVELGPHIIKEEVDAEGKKGRKAQYDNATYIHREYPEKPYAGQVTVAYTATEEFTEVSGTNYTVSGTAVGTIKISTTTPAKTTTSTSDVELSWWDARVSGVSGAGNPLTDGSQWDIDFSNPTKGLRRPKGIRSWQDENYYTSSWGPGNLNWPYWGQAYRISQGSTGDRVKFLQEALNRFMRAGFFSTNVGKLVVDGVYGPKTKEAVRDFQVKMAARYIDGVVDAETWSLVGFQIHRLAAEGKLGSFSSKNHEKWFTNHKYLQPHRMSDGSDGSWIAKRSWFSGGPSIIWEMYRITFDKSYKWRGLTVVPYLTGSAQDMMVRSIHVLNSPVSLTNYNSTRGQLIYMPHRPKDGQRLHIPFGPYSGDTIILGIGQDKSSGYGSARILGLRDVRGHTRITTTTTIPSTTTISYQQEDVNFTISGSINVESFTDKTKQFQAPKIAGYTSLSDIKFTGITVTNPDVTASITSGGLATFQTQIVTNSLGTEVRKGQKFPAAGFTYYSMDENKRLNPIPETGWVSKADGIKLLCDANKKPIGFPSLPTAVGTNEYQRHYTKFSLGSFGTDPSVQLCFYDVSKKEFVTSVDGRPEISYLEYLNRGPQNIYIGILSDYEIANETVIPEDEDAPRLPYRWAMPVYGVCQRAGSKITLEPLPEKLGARDIWPIAVREGRFTRNVKVRSRSEGRLTGWIGPYQNTTLSALYALPEADLGGYSKIYGPPYSDIVDEEPIIQDDDVLQVRQAPILLRQHFTATPGPADPWRPVLKLYKRDTLTSPWVEQPWSAIKDWNTSTGEIFLSSPLTSTDSALLRVDYTSAKRQYLFKKQDDTILNLNAFSGHSRDLLGKAIYVYIVPHYVKDSAGRVIPGSVNERTLRVAFSPDIFDPLRPDYDPLAVQLGVVYMSTALSVDKVAVLDTRRRGGGLRDNANVQEIVRLIREASTYWDVGYAAGGSYQKAGFVVIRLPEELKQDFSEGELKDIINRNITAGVGYKLETLDGKDWSS